MTLLGLPVEVYTNGTQQWASIISVIGVGLALNYIYLPVFYDLQCTTCFAYLELRFDGRVKNLVSLLYTISMLLFIPTVIYIPAIAFNQGMFSIESSINRTCIKFHSFVRNTIPQECICAIGDDAQYSIIKKSLP